MITVSVTVNTAASRRGARDASFKEDQHPRADNGQFGAGKKVHVVTTHDPESGESDVRHVGPNAAGAHAAHAEAEEEGHDSAEYHTVKLERAPGAEGTVKSVSVVHAPDGAGGTDVHGAYDSSELAHQRAAKFSESDWDEYGGTRDELGLHPDEQRDVADTWNAEHAADHSDVRVKVRDDGQPDLDDDGEVQFTQDGEDVEPTAEMRNAYAELQEDMYPADDVARYPGLDAANEHFAAEGRHEATYHVHTHEVGS